MQQQNPTIAIIGCGPAGIFFLHALLFRRRRLEKEGNHQAIASLPVVTCFESASVPGGVWNSDRNGKAPGTNMYEALWTNGPHTAMEFFDYSFDEHFGRALPMYLPRKHVLEYILARVTKNSPNFFDNVQFNTSVQSVKYDAGIRKFKIKTCDIKTSMVTMHHFDKCIWAAGTNGKPKVPQAISDILSDGGFKGKVMHSSQIALNFEKDVRDKRILLIGDSYSAEDLTLQAIKLGVKKVKICSRSGKGIAYETASWPMDKVDVVLGYLPSKVTNNGHGIVMSKSVYDYEKEEYVRTGETEVLDKIDTIIYCTGYNHNNDMLDISLRPRYDTTNFSKHDFPKDWQMRENPLADEFGNIPLGEVVASTFVQKDLYRGLLISNTDMMFVYDRTDFPLFDLDIQAWILLAHIMGDLPIPSQEQINRFNLEQFLNEMKDPICRSECDSNYKKCWGLLGDNHWSNNPCDVRVKKMLREYYALQYHILARDMIDSNYPLDIGCYGKLNEKGEALVRCNMECSYARYNLDEDSSEATWRTFRDCDPKNCSSVITGKQAVPLHCHWIDLEGDIL